MNKINRRMAIAMTGGATAAAILVPQDAAASDLSTQLRDLIADHSAAYEEMERASDRLADAEEAFANAYYKAPPALFHVTNGSHREIRPKETGDGLRERLQQEIAEHFDRNRREARACIPETGLADALRHIDREQRAVYRRLLHAVRKQAERPLDIAYRTADRAMIEAMDRETEASIALLSYRCRNMAEITAKFAHIAERQTMVEDATMNPEHAAALLGAFGVQSA